MRRLVALLIILGVLTLAWTGGWFWLADWAERNADSVLAEIAERGLEVDCPDRKVGGFPFALRVSCGATEVADRDSNTEATFTGLTGGTSVLNPTTAEVVLTSPAQVRSPLLEGPAEIAWHEAEIDVAIGMGGPSSVSFDSEDVLASFALAGAGDPRIAATQAAGTLEPSEDGGTAATVSFADLAISTDITSLPPISGTASGIISAPPRALLSGSAGLQAPLSAHAIQVTLTSGGATMQLEGDLAVDAEGIVDGALTLRIAGAEALPTFVAALPEEQRQIGTAAAGALFIFGRPTTLNGEPASEILIEVERGMARVGPVEMPLPRLPLWNPAGS
jgi:hypothetical protein